MILFKVEFFTIYAHNNDWQSSFNTLRASVTIRPVPVVSTRSKPKHIHDARVACQTGELIKQPLALRCFYIVCQLAVRNLVLTVGESLKPEQCVNSLKIYLADETKIVVVCAFF